MSLPCWHEQKNYLLDNKMRNNDTINLKLCTMININSLHPIPASVFEVDAKVIIYSWKKDIYQNLWLCQQTKAKNNRINCPV